MGACRKLSMSEKALHHLPPIPFTPIVIPFWTFIRSTVLTFEVTLFNSRLPDVHKIAFVDKE